jgi:hypothetical protein
MAAGVREGWFSRGSALAVELGGLEEPAPGAA